jgi:prepilin-type N-terminal cleavage/methylation domain-containing protein
MSLIGVKDMIEHQSEWIEPSARRERGFTMIEICIAIAVLVVGLVSIVAVSAYVSRANATSNTMSVLATSAQDVIDNLRSARWTRKSEAAGTDDPSIRVGGTVDEKYLDSDELDPHHSMVRSDTAAGEVVVLWQVAQGPTPDIRLVTVRVVQKGAPPFLREGLRVSTMIHRK